MTNETFLICYVSKDTKIIGIDHPTDAKFSDVLNAHIALRDHINMRLENMHKCPFSPKD